MDIQRNETSQEITPARKDTLSEIGVFVGTLAIAYWSGWTTRDLIWSLWLSSLFAGYLAVVVSGGVRIFRRGLNAVERSFAVLGLIGVLIGFTIHFGSFHYLYASMLDLLMPLMDHPGRVYVGKLSWKGGSWFSIWETLAIAVTRYWPVVVMNAWRDRATILAEETTKENLGPYKAVLRLFFLVMGLGCCYELGLDSFPVYAAVFTLLYSPAALWKRLFYRDSSAVKTK